MGPLFMLLYIIYLIPFGLIYNFCNYLYRRKKIDFSRISVIVTGADSGFGNNLALQLLDKGIKVYVGCFTHVGLKAFQMSNPLCVAFAIDVRDPDSVKSAIETVEENMAVGEKVWALVNNAGIAGNLCFELSSIEDYAAVMDVNFYGQIRMCEAFIPLIVGSKGRIINVGSAHGRLSHYGVPHTCSKLALEHYTNGLRRKMNRFGVQVITVEPGFFSHTKLFEKTWNILNAKYNRLSHDRRMESLTPRQILQVFANMERWWLTKSFNFEMMVADDLYHAITSVRPKMRYTVGLDAYFTKCFATLAPDWFLDWIISFAERKARRTKDKPKYKWPQNITLEDGNGDEFSNMNLE